MSAARKKAWADPEVRARMSAARKRYALALQAARKSLPEAERQRLLAS